MRRTGFRKIAFAAGLLLLLGTGPQPVYAQSLRYNNPDDSSDVRVRTAVHFLESYLAGFHRDTVPDYRRFWPAEDCKAAHPDPSVYAIASDWPTYSMRYRSRTVLAVGVLDSVVHLKVQYADADSAPHVQTLCVANHFIATGADGQLHFVSPAKRYTAGWARKKVGTLTYLYSPQYRFDLRAAQRTLTRVKALEKEWGLKPIPITYYVAESYREVQALRGLDYAFGTSLGNTPAGISDAEDRMVWSGGWGEAYFHEVVHVYLNPLFPESPMLEGLAVMYGGSLGHDLAWHTARLRGYVEANPNLNLSDWYYWDSQTNPRSTLNGLICYWVYRRHGIAGLQQMMMRKTVQEVLERDLGIYSDADLDNAYHMLLRLEK